MSLMAEINRLSREYALEDYRDTLIDAIGPDYQQIGLHDWPERARRNGYPVDETQALHLPEFFKSLYRPGRRPNGIIEA